MSLKIKDAVASADAADAADADDATYKRRKTFYDNHYGENWSCSIFHEFRQKMLTKMNFTKCIKT